MDFDSVLNLELKRFWFLNNQIDRLRAEQDLRRLQILGSVNDGDTYKQALDNLQEQMGQVFVWGKTDESIEIRIDPVTGLDPEFDREGLHSLKGMGKIR